MGVTEDQVSIATIRRLSTALAARTPTMSKYDAYYHGNQGRRLTATKSYNELFTKRYEEFCENFCGLVVDALADRLEVDGFRFPKDGTAISPVITDDDAWRIWQDNNLDAESQSLFTETLIKGLAYILVSPFEDDKVGDSPGIFIEDALETITEHRPGRWKDRLVGMKRWYDDIVGRTYVTLYWPDRIEKWQSGGRAWANQHGSGFIANDAWEKRLVPGEPWPLANTLGVVPLIPLRNRPGLNGAYESELAQVTPIQDAINTLAMNELVASEESAYRQKYAIGVEVPKDEKGEDVKEWRSSIKRLLSTTVPKTEAAFGSFEASDISQYGDAIDRHVQRLASVSQTPYHMFQQHSGQPPSGESLAASEVPLVQKAKSRQRHFSDPLEEVMRLAFKSQKDARANVTNAATDWANPETMTESAHVDATTKKRGVKVPLKQLWRDLGYTPEQIASFGPMLKEETSMLAGTLVAPVDPAGAAVQEQIQERVSA